jgi:hypothetical protein
MRKIITKKKNDDIEPLNNLIRRIDNDFEKVNVRGLNGAARPFLVSLLFERLDKPLLVVCPEEKDAMAFTRNLSLFLGEESVFHYPSLKDPVLLLHSLAKHQCFFWTCFISRVQLFYSLLIDKVLLFDARSI